MLQLPISYYLGQHAITQRTNCCLNAHLLGNICYLCELLHCNSFDVAMRQESVETLLFLTYVEKNGTPLLERFSPLVVKYLCF